MDEVEPGAQAGVEESGDGGVGPGPGTEGAARPVRDEAAADVEQATEPCCGEAGQGEPEAEPLTEFQRARDAAEAAALATGEPYLPELGAAMLRVGQVEGPMFEALTEFVRAHRQLSEYAGPALTAPLMVRYEAVIDSTQNVINACHQEVQRAYAMADAYRFDLEACREELPDVG